KGFIVMGQNPVVGSANGGLQRRALANLEWLVVRDTVETETAAFWEDDPECATEVFFLPAAAHTEKDGSFTNTQRLLQWHFKAVEPPEDCRSELWFIYHLMRRIRSRLEGSESAADRGILDLRWDYPTQGPHDEPDAEAVLQETSPFIPHPDGLGWLYAPQGLVDGPLPAHYEPHETPFAENAMYRQHGNPTRQVFERPENPYNPPGSDVFPYVLTTYRLTE